MTVRLIEGQVPYTGGTAIEITADKVINLLLREENNLLQVNGDNELYCDLQLVNGIAPTDDFPVGVTTGIVNANDGWDQNGLLLHYEVTSGAYAQWLYGADGKIYFDGGTGTFKQVYYAEEVDALIQQFIDMIGDATLTIQRNGTTIGTFTANSKIDTTVNISVPTALSDLTNDLVNDGKLTIRRNNTVVGEFTANDATNVYADIPVPEVVNNTTTIDSVNALSAAMGKELQDQINNINMIGRFLSLWNCATGLPQTNPTTSPYMYHTGDYYVIGTVDATTNYKPDGGSYTIGVASTTVETLTVGVGDMYFYDGTTWTLKKFTGQTFPIDNVLSTTSTNAVENRVVTNALNTKQDTLTASTGISIDAQNNIENTGVISVNGNTGVVLVDEGDVYGPSSATDGNLAVFDGATGKLIKDGGAIPTGFNPGNVGNTNQLLTKTANGYEWANAPENTKTFYASGNTDLTTAQAILDYYLDGNNPILNTGNGVNWIMTNDTGTTLVFSNDNLSSFNDPNGTSTEGQYTTWEITYSGTTATQITNATYINSGRLSPYLSTTINYSTPYNPVYDGSPATKKYVDDAVFSKIAYSEFEFETATSGATLTVSDLNTNFTPNQNFSIAHGTLKEGMQYIVRINTGATAYTMSLGTGVTNPFGEDLTLTASKITTLVFLATSSSTLELFSARTAS